MISNIVTVALFLGALSIPLLLVRRRGRVTPDVVRMESSLLLPGGERLYVVVIEGERVLLSGTKGNLELMWRLKGPLLGGLRADHGAPAPGLAVAMVNKADDNGWHAPRGTTAPTATRAIVECGLISAGERV